MMGWADGAREGRALHIENSRSVIGPAPDSGGIACFSGCVISEAREESDDRPYSWDGPSWAIIWCL